MLELVRVCAEYLAACDAQPLTIVVKSLESRLRSVEPDVANAAVLQACLAHPGTIKDARLVLDFAVHCATDDEVLALSRKLVQVWIPERPELGFHAANAARLLSRLSIDRLVASLPSPSEVDGNVAFAHGVAVMLAARREGCEIPPSALPLIHRGLHSVNRIDETLLCELIDAPWDRIYAKPAERPWLCRIGDATASLDGLGAFETVAVAMTADHSDTLAQRWLDAKNGIDRLRFSAALAWGTPLSRAAELITALPNRSFIERQSIFAGLARHGDALLPVLDQALADPQTQRVATLLLRELPVSDVVRARIEALMTDDDWVMKLELHPQVCQVKLDRTLDPRPIGVAMLHAFLRSGRNVTTQVLEPAQRAFTDGNCASLAAAWLFFTSETLTQASAPAASGLVDAWRSFVLASVSELRGVIHLARALVMLPDRESLECEGGTAMAWTDGAVDTILNWLLARDPPTWRQEELDAE